jgi:hypothetical protein
MTDKPTKLSVKGIETEAVQNYLNQYPFLKPVLQEAEEQIAQHFGEDAEIAYKVEYDPEIASMITLFGYIWTNLTVDEALAIFDKFDEAWYLDLSYEIRSRLNFQIRLRRR